MSAAAMASAASFSVDRVDPPHWWTGMHSPSLQLQVHGSNVRPADFSVSYPGVTVDSVVRLDGSPDWQYVYLSLAPDVKPGEMKLQWKEGRKTVTRAYELRERRPMKGAAGFSAADLLYLVMPDRFADGDTTNNRVASMRFPVGADRSDPNTRHGGDIAGLMRHLDYIDSLGVTAVWVNPVLDNDMPGGSYHGYATTDYYSIDPRFGSNADYTALIDSLHSRGIKTVMDMIFNHSGSEHPWALNPPASDWFNNQGDYRQTNYRLSTITDRYASDYDRGLSVHGWFVREMPDLNQRNPHLMKYLSQNSIWWIEESQIDGIRMDTYPYADREAMARWIDDVLAEYPAFNIVGECWFAEPAAISTWQKGSPLAKAAGFDSNLPTVMDFPLMIKSRDMAPFREDTDPWHGLNSIYDHLALDYIYADPLKVLRFLDNHDTERFIQTMPDSLAQWKQAITLLLTAPGIPQLYYGTELLMSGTREGGDGMVRKDMPGGFPGDTVSVFTSAGRTPMQREAYDFISRLAGWRKGSRAVAEGSMLHFMPDNGAYLYVRRAGGDEVVVVLNGRDVPNEVDMSRYASAIPTGQRYSDVLTGEEVTLRPVSDTLMLAPRQIYVLQPIK